MRLIATSLALALLNPVTPATVVAPFRAPAGAYAAGHRGVDLIATPGQEVRSPMSGTIRFAGRVAGKDVVTIGDGPRVVSLEPVVSDLPVGSYISAGEQVGRIGLGGHCSLHCVHVALRVDGNYVEPMRQRALLVP